MNISDNAWLLISLFSVITIFIAIWKLDALSYVYDVHIYNNRLDFILLSCFKISTLYFDEIDYVKETTGGYSYLFVLNFKNRLFHTTFFIRKSKGIFARQLLITPNDSKQFVDKLESAGVKIILRDKV
jgi:hypothetical protein